MERLQPQDVYSLHGNSHKRPTAYLATLLLGFSSSVSWQYPSRGHHRISSLATGTPRDCGDHSRSLCPAVAKRSGQAKAELGDEDSGEKSVHLLAPSAASSNEVSFDSAALGGIFIEAQAGDWRMWYHGRSLDAPKDIVPLSMGSIGYAYSTDGLSWTKSPTGATFTPRVEVDSAFDSVLVGMGNILSHGGEEAPWLYYFGGGPEPFEPRGPGGPVLRGVRQNIGLARGELWNDRREVLARGNDDAWDALFLASPQVLKHGEDDFRMYYHSMTAGRFSVGLATSKDGIAWEKQGQILQPGPSGSWDARGCSRRFVMRDPKGDGYIMFYEGSGDGNRHGIGVARSDDGLVSWKRESDAPVFEPVTDGNATRAVSSPCVVQVPGKSDTFRLYYVRIGLDESSGVGVVETSLNDFPYGWRRI